MGATFHRAACCCVTDWCLGCADAEPDAVVTIAGTCEEWCEDFDGIYVFSSTSHDGVDNEYCWWVIDHPTISAYKLNLLYCVDSDQWYARIAGIAVYYGGAVDNPCTGITADDWKAVDITCSGGELSGSFDLDGLGDCAGCTASVTLA